MVGCLICKLIYLFLFQWVSENKVCLFMKGDPKEPMCGFSNFVVQTLKFYSNTLNLLLIASARVANIDRIAIIQIDTLFNSFWKKNNKGMMNNNIFSRKKMRVTYLTFAILCWIEIKEYKSIDVLKYEVIRKQAKQYSNWPTFPQLYVDGKLIGGSDIVSEMHKDGSLSELFRENNLVD